MSVVSSMLAQHVFGIAINRPEARNAINADVAKGIEEALNTYEANDDAWVAILSGNGSNFSAGADLKEISAGNISALSTPRGGFAGIVSRHRTKPLIAAVQGSALAGGLEIALSCDLIVATRSTRFGLPEVKRSLAAAAGGLFRLPRVLPTNLANELILTGDPILASRAYELGMVNVLCEDDQLDRASLELAHRVVANAPLAVRESLAISKAAFTLSDNELFTLSSSAISKLSKTDDFAEGLTAFIQKRSPLWTGT